MKKFYLFLFLSCLCITGYSQTSSFVYTGAMQTYSVGPGVTTLGIDMGGAEGGQYPGIATPGYGGRVQCVLTVTPGQLLYIYVGQQGPNGGTGTVNPGGGNSGGGAVGGSGDNSDGGGSGGGSTDIRTISGSTMASLSSRIVVAGAGGAASFVSGENGGLGGGLTGGGGYSSGSTPFSPPNGATQTAGGIAEGSGLAGTFGVGGNAYCCYWGGGGGGGWFGGGGCYGGSGGGGSSYTAPGIVTAVTHTQGYRTGNGYVNITVLCAAPGVVVGPSTICTGTTTTYTNPTGATGGTWSSSNTAYAVVNPTTGAVTAVTPGVVTITYNVSNPCGPLASQVVTVSQAASIVSGTSTLCTGQATTITAAPAGGTWSSSNTTAATVVSTGGATGAAVGGAVGTANIIYTLPSGCAASDAVTVNVSPIYHTVTETGTGGYCAGNPTVVIGLNGSSTGTNYNLYSGATLVSSVPVAGTGSPLIFTPDPVTAPGTYTVIANIAGCSLTMIGSATVFLNPNPSAPIGPTSVCSGSTISLSSSPLGGTWSSNNIAAASVGVSTGIISGIVPGTATLTYTLAGGCNVSTVVTVNATPAPITGTASVCVGATTLLSNASTGGTWSSSSASVASVNVVTGLVTGVSAGTPTVSYSLGSGCYATTAVAVNLLPAAETITGGGPYCAGLGTHVGLSYAATGITYQLYNGAAPVGGTVSGAGSSLDFGLEYAPGTYTVFASNPLTSCSSNMPGSTTISINPLPNSSYIVGGTGSYCAGGTGVSLTLSNSDFGTSYQLINGGPVGSAVPGVGGSLSFGPQTLSGTYTVVATTSAGCVATLTSSATVSINPLPNAYPVSIGGTYCAGGTGADVSLGGSDLGTSYQLFNGTTSVGSPITGTGSAIDFGSQLAGNYTIMATTSSSPACSANMSGISVVSTTSLPAPYIVNGGGPYCAGSGSHVGLNYSDPGVSYQLYVNSTATGSPVIGSSAGIDFGLQTTPGVYTVVATNAAGCVANMSGSVIVTMNAQPNAYPVTGGGPYCTGGTGSSVGLLGSSVGISYQLFSGSTPVGGAITGTGAPLTFGLQTATGTYTIVATNMATACTSVMSGSALVTVAPLPTPYGVGTATSSSSYCAGGEGVDILLDGSDVGTNYQLYKGLLPIGTSMPGTGSSIDFGYKTIPGTYTIVANTPATTCSSTMSGNVPISINALPNVYTATGGGNFCLGAPGKHVGLSGSNTGVNYQLYYNSVLVPGAVLAGTGVSLDFGYETNSGVYTVVATNATTYCTINMAGSSTVVANTLPDTFSLTGDGSSYCASASGSPVGLVGSASGISYQLYNGAATAGAAIPGTGLPVSFGNHIAGTYTVVATNSATGCTNNMPGSATISVNALPAAFAVNGGGNVCSGSAGTAVGLDSSVSGVSYQLYYAGLPTPTIVTGTGSGITFGLENGAGAYTAVGIDGTTSCTSNMTGSVSITLIPSPAINNVVGGGPFCAGGTGVPVGLTSTTPGIVYQLNNGSTMVGTTTGTGAAIDFGLQTMAGTYTVVASPGGTCQTTMSGSATVVVNPLPDAYSLLGGGVICSGGAGKDISLSGSTSGVNYQLYNGSIAVGTVHDGSGGAIDFLTQTLPGSYSVVAVNTTTGCTNTMAGSGSVVITVSALPFAYNVTGGGNYCSGGEGVHVVLRGSATDVNYQLYNSGTSVGSPMAGSGTELDFGLLTAVGNYTIVGTDAYTGCVNNMADTAVIAISPNLVPVVTVTAIPSGTVSKGQTITFIAHAPAATAGTSPTYQWYVDGLPVTGAVDSIYSSSQFSNRDSVRCEVISSGMCGGYPGSSSVTISISTEGVQQITAAGSNLSLMPNPNKGEFTIKGTLGTNDDEAVSIEITDIVGHVVYTEQVMSHNGSINENIALGGTLSNGMYIVNLHAASANQVFHMVIEQ